jgi:hypothetical protein
MNFSVVPSYRKARLDISDCFSLPWLQSNLTRERLSTLSGKENPVQIVMFALLMQSSMKMSLIMLMCMLSAAQEILAIATSSTARGAPIPKTTLKESISSFYITPTSRVEMATAKSTVSVTTSALRAASEEPKIEYKPSTIYNVYHGDGEENNVQDDIRRKRLGIVGELKVLSTVRTSTRTLSIGCTATFTPFITTGLFPTIIVVKASSTAGAVCTRPTCSYTKTLILTSIFTVSPFLSVLSFMNL